MYNSFTYPLSIYCMLDADKSHLEVTSVSQSLYSGPLSNPDFFLSLIAGRIRQVVLYMQKKVQISCVVAMPRSLLISLFVFAT